ncbi:hypothetical protein J2857_003148 [Neorhizobium galegae]|uniref:hypothetical protein n=1 Tax=Neorhizobium galegae TaxID=399 RepID=UPI001AEB9EC7|nr:hypothetical protein [Neorhizobium galegae]MBP2560379.1 hypothetical protein [Neorhizobium galegae]
MKIMHRRETKPMTGRQSSASSSRLSAPVAAYLYKKIVEGISEKKQADQPNEQNKQKIECRAIRLLNEQHCRERHTRPNRSPSFAFKIAPTEAVFRMNLSVFPSLPVTQAFKGFAGRYFFPQPFRKPKAKTLRQARILESPQPLLAA